MQVHIEEVGPCKRKLNVQVPAEDVKTKFDEHYENLRKNLELPGFRRGHVPRRLIEKRFGEDIAGDVRQAMLEETYSKAVEENELDVIGQPDFPEDLAAVTEDQPFEYQVDVEVRPKFDLPDYSQLSLKRPIAEPTEEEINSRLEYYRHRTATSETVDREANEDDTVVADVRVKVGDEVIWDRESLPFPVKSTSVAGMDVENLAAEMTGAKAGDTRNVKATISDRFPVEEHRGKEAELVIEVKKVEHLILPEATDDWAKEMGFDSLDELKEEFINQIKRMKESNAREQLRLQIRDQLAEMVAMDLPEKLRTSVAEDSKERRRMALQYQGLDEEEIAKRMAEEEEAAAGTEDKNLKLYFIFDAIAKAETILVTEEEMTSRVEQLSVNYGVESDQLWRWMEADGRLDSLRKEVLDEKIVDFLIDKAHVEDMTAEEAKSAGEEGKEKEAE